MSEQQMMDNPAGPEPGPQAGEAVQVQAQGAPPVGSVAQDCGHDQGGPQAQPAQAEPGACACDAQTGQPMSGYGEPLMGQESCNCGGAQMGAPMGQPMGQPMAGYGEPQMGQESCNCGDAQMGAPSEGYGGPRMGQPGNTYGGPMMGQRAPMGGFPGYMPGNAGGPQMGQPPYPGPMGGPAVGPEGQPHHCSHHMPYPGPFAGPFPGPMPGPFPGAAPGAMPGMPPGFMPGAAYGAHPGFGPANSPMAQAAQSEAQLGKMMNMFSDIVNGKTDMSQVAGFLGGMDGSFWKGAVLGAALALMVSSPMVSDTITGLFSGLTGGGAKSETSAPDAGEEA